MKTIRWGIIGCGNVTEIKSGPGFQKAENSTLIAVMRRNGELARDYAVRHGVPKWYDDAEQLINDPEVDAVYIATPPGSHKEYALKCAEAGKPIYVEKPMALNYEECEAMRKACELAGVPLFVAYYRRGLARFNKIKELITNGTIGDIRLVNVKYYTKPLKIENNNVPWRVIPEISGGGIFLDIGCHILDVLDYILGPIKHVKGSASNQAGLYKAEDIVTADFVFKSGVHGTGSWCFSTFEHYDNVEILGTEGKLSFSTFGSEPIILTNEDGIQEFSIETPKHIQQPLIQTIVDELNGKGICPSKGESAARTSWVMDQIIKEYYSKV